MRAFASVSLGLALALLAGCAPKTPPATVAMTPPPPAPERPLDLPETLRVPALRADGRYATINRDLSAAATIWHVRSALNVAALGCRGVDEAAMIAGYNRLLKSRKAALATADAAVQAEFRAREPLAWQASHDAYLTRLYNFFAQPLAPTRFCAEALALASEADALPDADLAAWAPVALSRLEAPFTDTYARYDDWRMRQAAWAAGNPVAPPRLAYAGLDMVIAWSPEAAGPLRTASIR